MITKLVRLLLGWREYLVREGSDTAADILATSGADIKYIRMSKEGLCFAIRLSQCSMIETVLGAKGIILETIREHGIWRIFRKYKRRVGIPIGAAIFFLLIFLSEQFIWSFEVIGNEKIPDREIIAHLDKLGCAVGTYIPSIDFDTLHSTFLLEDERFSWVSVNLRGTHASVEVRETKPPTTVIDEDTPHNLVASEDGIVEYIEILRGQKIAREDEMVREGELLASGIVQMKHGLSLVHARGTVTARVKRTVKIEVPFEDTAREPTGREFSEKTLNFFGISIKLFKNTSNLPENCDKIEREAPLCFFDAVTVPITLHETVYREYTDVPIARSEDEAKAEAFKRFKEECCAVAADAELVSREVSSGVVGGAYVIECELTVVKNIAREVPIYLENDTGEN